MIVGYEQHLNNAVNIRWIGTDGTLYKREVALTGKTGRALPIVRNNELYALMVCTDPSSDSKVVKVSTVLDCCHPTHWSYIKRIDADTYIHSPYPTLGRCLRIKFTGDEYSIEGEPDGDRFHRYDGERYWKYQKTLSGTVCYISSDQAHSFELPDDFGVFQDAWNGLILNLDVKEGREGRYMLYVLCSRTRDMIWSFKASAGMPIYYIYATFVNDYVVFAQLLDREKSTYVIINIVDNTKYELAFCG
jgi:hypothetical protein